MFRISALVAGILGLGSRPVLAQIEIEGFLGSSFSAPTPLSITQRSQPNVHVTAHWATRPFRPTWYYTARLGLWRRDSGWLFDFTHHKLDMTRWPREIQQVELFNGMNVSTVSRGFRRTKLSWAVGAGPVITFPANRVGYAVPR